jgi:hypothetical protein
MWGVRPFPDFDTIEQVVLTLHDEAHKVMNRIPDRASAGTLWYSDQQRFPQAAYAAALDAKLLFLQGLQLVDGFHVLTATAAAENGYNQPTSSVVIRAVAEHACWVAWLLDPGASEQERAVRYIRWRSRSHHHLYRAAAKGLRQAVEHMPDDLRQLQELAGEVGVQLEQWRPLKSEGSKWADLKVEDVMGILQGDETFYLWTSAAAHGERWATWFSTVEASPPDRDGFVTAEVFGAGIEQRRAVAALARTLALLVTSTGRYHRLSTKRFDERVAYLLGPA